MKLIFVSICFLFAAVGFGQSGYLGKRNFIEIKAGVVPSYKFQNVIKDDMAIERLKVGNMNYHFAYSRVLSPHFVLSIGYDFTKINCLSQGHWFNQTNVITYPGGGTYEEQKTLNILDDPELIYHGGTVVFDYYRLGSLAPIGKYIGASLSYGIAGSTDPTILAGIRGITDKQNFFRKISEIGVMDTFSYTHQYSVSTFNLKARIGRNYPLTDNLMLSVGMTFPLISRYASGTKSSFGFQLESNSVDVDETATSWNNYYMRSVYFYSRVTFEAAIRYHF